MLKDALLPIDEVKDSEDMVFTVLAASPHEAVLEISPESHAEDPNLNQFYIVDRNEQGYWVFRDDPTIHLVELD